MNTTNAKLVDERKNPSSNGGLPDGAHSGEGAAGGLVLEHNAIELRDVEVVGGGARRDGEGEAIAGEDGLG